MLKKLLIGSAVSASFLLVGCEEMHGPGVEMMNYQTPRVHHETVVTEVREEKVEHVRRVRHHRPHHHHHAKKEASSNESSSSNSSGSSSTSSSSETAPANQ